MKGSLVCSAYASQQFLRSVPDPQHSRASLRKIPLPISEFSFQFYVLDYDLGLCGSFMICDFDFDFEFSIMFRVLVFFNFWYALKILF